LSSVAVVIWLLVVIVLALVAAGVGIGRNVSRRRAIGGVSAPVHIDAFTIGEPWRRHVSAAQSTERRYDAIVKTVDPGPLRDRLTEIGRQVRRGVEEGWQIARRGDEVDAALRRLDTPSLQARLTRATDDATKASLQSQLDAGSRIRATRDDADHRLRTLNTRLDELVAQAAEVSLGTDSTAELGTGVDDVITQLEALRLAITDVNAAAGEGPANAAAARPTDSSPTGPADPSGASPTDSSGAGPADPSGAGTTSPPS
jgi:hypothetical protein